MNALGIFTGLDMRNQTLQFMNANFGKSGAYYYWISRGVDDRPVRANRIRKSVGAENTLSTDLNEADAMIAELEPLIDKIWRHCESAGTRGPTVTLKVNFSDFEITTRNRSVSSAIAQSRWPGLSAHRPNVSAIERTVFRPLHAPDLACSRRVRRRLHC